MENEEELMRELDKLKMNYSNLDQFNLVLYRLYLAAKSLRNSGYDGPLMGEESRDLFQKIAEVERFIKGE